MEDEVIRVDKKAVLILILYIWISILTATFLYKTVNYDYTNFINILKSHKGIE